MKLPELLRRVDELQARILAAGPLAPEAKRKLDYRFRLDWNYHSNVMEGSSLTQQETRSIMLGNVTVSGKPIKDVLEMQGHDKLITQLLGMAKGDLNLSEARIREVHRAIVHEDDPAKQGQVGQWKREPNYLLNYKGERFDFPPPEAVPEAMHKLLDGTKADIERIERNAKEAPHPALLAFNFHLEYVSIHPFHDGNGRTARIFSNLLLMRFGYPPVVIQVDEKEAYNRYLAEVQAYGASPDLFFAFMAERLIRAQELVIDAIEGRTLEEDDQVLRRAELLHRIAEGRRLSAEEQTRRKAERISMWLDQNQDAFLARLQNVFEPVTRFFDHHRWGYKVPFGVGRATVQWPFALLPVEELKALLEDNDDPMINVSISFSGFKYGTGLDQLGAEMQLNFQDDHVEFRWLGGPERVDRVSYTDRVADVDLPSMRQVAQALLDRVEDTLQKDK
jgi:Fic family protein